MVIIIHPDGRIVREEASRCPPLEVMQRTVGGYIELVLDFEEFEGQRCQAYCNEDGKRMLLALNETATRLWHEQSPRFKAVKEGLVGTVLILTGKTRSK